MTVLTEAVVADTETSGFEPETCGLLEVAAVFAPKRGNGDLGWQSFVEFEGTIPPDAKAVHHIQEHEVARGAPFCNPREAVVEKLLSFDSGSTAYVFHNSAFDVGFLPELRERPLICTYRCALHVWPDAPSHKNTALMYWLGTKPDPRLTVGLAAHRALFDAAVTTSLLEHMLKSHTLDDLVALTQKPVLLTTVRFGKHKGEKWADVPRDYAQWALYRSDMAAENPDLKYTLEVRLGLRDAA